MTRSVRRVGLIGFGAIGKVVAEILERDASLQMEVVGILTHNARPDTGSGLARTAKLTTDMDALIACQPDLVVECAGHAALAARAPRILESGIDVMAASVGALADPAVFAMISEAAARGGSRVIIPSGAIGGLDWLAAARLAGLSRVVYRARKPQATWVAAGAVEAQDIDVSSDPKVFYRDTVRAAARRFPKNTNVAAAVALATLGFDQTTVELIATGSANENVHEVEAGSAVGALTLQIRGRSDPGNPNTSMITAYSLAQCVLSRASTFVI